MSIFLSFFLLHFLIFFCLLFKNHFSKVINEQLFFMKTLILFGSFFGFLFLDNSGFYYMFEISKIGGHIFMAFQNVCLTDLSFLVSEFLWDKNKSKRSSFYEILMFFGFMFCLFLIGVSIFINFMNFWINDCFFNKLVIIINICMVILLIFISFFRLDKRVHFFAGGFIALMVSLNIGTSMRSYFDEDCNPFFKQKDQNSFFISIYPNLMINLFIAFLTIFFSAISSDTSQTLQISHLNYIKLQETSNLDLSRSLDDNIDLESITIGLHREFNNSIYSYETNYFIKYHFSILILLMYLTTLFIDWGKINVENGKIESIILGDKRTFYWKMFGNGVLIMLYFWIMVFTRCCRKRL